MGFPVTVEIGNQTYEMVENKTSIKPTIDLFVKSENKVSTLDEPDYNRIRRCVYHTIKSIDSLSDGNIKSYEVWNLLELELISGYLEQRKILYLLQVYRKDYYYRYIEGQLMIKVGDFYKCYFHPNENLAFSKFVENFRVRIRVYKGFVNPCELPRDYQPRPQHIIYLMTKDQIDFSIYDVPKERMEVKANSTSQGD